MTTTQTQYGQTQRSFDKDDATEFYYIPSWKPIWGHPRSNILWDDYFDEVPTDIVANELFIGRQPDASLIYSDEFENTELPASGETVEFIVIGGELVARSEITTLQVSQEDSVTVSFSGTDISTMASRRGDALTVTLVSSSPSPVFDTSLPPHIAHRLAHLSSLEYDWDGYGAFPINPRSIKVAEFISAQVIRMGLPVPFISPNTDGSLTLERRLDSDREVIIDIEPNGNVTCLLSDTDASGQETESELTLRNEREISMFLRNLAD